MKKMLRSGNDDPASGAQPSAEDREREEAARQLALTARAETLRRACELAGQLADRPANRVLLLNKYIQILLHITELPQRIDGWLLYEELLEAKDAIEDGRPGLVHFGLVLDPQGQIIQFMNGGKDYNADHPERTVHATYCKQLGADPALDDGPPLLFDPAGRIVAGESFWSYEAYNAAGCEQALQYVLNGVELES